MKSGGGGDIQETGAADDGLSRYATSEVKTRKRELARASAALGGFPGRRARARKFREVVHAELRGFRNAAGGFFLFFLFVLLIVYRGVLGDAIEGNWP